MSNWKSTLCGSALAAADVITQFLSDPKFDWSEPRNYIRPVLFAALGFIVADARKPVQIVIFLLCASFLISSCAEYPLRAKLTTPYGSISTNKAGDLVFAPKARRIEFSIHHDK